MLREEHVEYLKKARVEHRDLEHDPDLRDWVDKFMPFARRGIRPIGYEGSSFWHSTWMVHLWDVLTDYRLCRCPACRHRLTKTHKVTPYSHFDLFVFTCPNCDYAYVGLLDLQ